MPGSPSARRRLLGGRTVVTMEASRSFDHPEQSRWPAGRARVRYSTTQRRPKNEMKQNTKDDHDDFMKFQHNIGS